jgi:hypothetical protein
MASAVEVFRQNAINNARLEAEAVANRTATEAVRIAEQERIAQESEQFRIASLALGDNLKRLACGDLTCCINTQFAPEYEPLRSDFNASVVQLSQTIGAVAVAVLNMDSGTREISTGANDLSRRPSGAIASGGVISLPRLQICSSTGNAEELVRAGAKISRGHRAVPFLADDLGLKCDHQSGHCFR